MAFPQNNIIIHRATVAKYMNELVMQYSNDENIIAFNGCPSQSMPPIGLLILGHWFCLKINITIIQVYLIIKIYQFMILHNSQKTNCNS